MNARMLAALLAVGMFGLGEMAARPGLSQQQPPTPPTTAAAPVLRLSLGDAIRRALDEGTAARLATTRIDIATAQARLAQSALPLQPQVSVGTLTANESINLATFGFSVPGQPAVTPPFNVLDVHITAAVELLNVAARRRYEAAKAGIRVGEEERRRIENDVAAAVSSLYVALGRSSARIDDIRSNVDLFEKLRQLAADQKKAGIGTKLDTTRAEVQLARQRQALLVATNQRDLARLALLRAVGADYDADVVLTDDWTRATGPVPPLAQALAAARRERLELSVLDRQLRVADLNLEAAKAEKLPTIAAQAQGTESGNRLRDLDWSRTVGATVNVPIFTGHRVEARVAEARALREQIVLQRGDIERQVEQEVRQALLGYENARSRVELANQSVQLAQDELELASDRFKNGIASSIEVDNAQTSLSTARDARIEALADEAQTRFDLARATGEIRTLIPGGGEAPAPASQNASK